MRLLPEARSRVSERIGAEVIRSAEMRGATLQTLRHAINLDRGAIGNEVAGEGRRPSGAGGRKSHPEAEPDTGESTSARVHPAARISGRGRCVRGLVQGRIEFSQPE